MAEGAASPESNKNNPVKKVLDKLGGFLDSLTRDPANAAAFGPPGSGNPSDKVIEAGKVLSDTGNPAGTQIK